MAMLDDEFADTGLTVRRVSEANIKPIEIPPDHDPLMIAARTAFPKTHKQKHAMIVHSYRDAYDGIPEADAVRAILQGYSSPAHAMGDGQLKRRPLKGCTR